MKIRWKFFLILMVFSLIPLFIVTIINQRATRLTGGQLTEDARKALTDISEKALEVAAANTAGIESQHRRAIEFRLMALAREAERILAENPPKKAVIYSPADFENSGQGPPDLGFDPRFVKKEYNGDLVPKPVSMDFPVIFSVPGANQEKIKNNMSRLTRLGPEFKAAFRQCTGVYWVYVALDSGVHSSYPGHGGYPRGYDPRMRPWYRSAMEIADNDLSVTWTFPMVDVSTGRVIFSASTRVRGPDGSVAGVAGMDILLSDILNTTEIPAMWLGHVDSFNIAIQTNPMTNEQDAMILAQKDYLQTAGSWTGLVAMEWLDSKDKKKLKNLISRMAKGESGHARLEYRGQDSIWAFAPIESPMDINYYKVIVAPMAAINAPIDKAGNVVSSLINNQLMLTGAAAIAALALLALAAFIGSRALAGQILVMVKAVRRLAEGDFSVKIDVRTGDERDQLVQAFNDMVPSLEENVRLRRALELAQEVQQNLLPASIPQIRGLDMAGAVIYSDETGGDYYDYLEMDEDNEHRVTVVVGDVSGHGIPSALLMTTARALFRQRSSMKGSVTAIVSDVNRLLTRDVEESGRFMTLFYMAIDTNEKWIKWLRAGHDPALVYDSASGCFDELKGRGMFLGGFADYKYEEYKREISPGQIIAIGTDGIWEARNEQGEMFGRKAFKKIIADHAHESAQSISDAVFNEVEQFRRPLSQEDDITLVVVKVLE